MKSAFPFIFNRGLAAFLSVTAIVWLASSSTGQDWSFTHDLNGNLEKQALASPLLPQILADPQTQVVEPGELASFFVVAKDTRSLTYQWRTNGVNLSGATNDALLLANVSAANEGLYSVVLSNSSGSVTSNPAMLWIDSDGDGLPDSWEQSYFGGLAQNPGSDFDSDGISNADEFSDGTNPTNTSSALFRLTVMSDGGVITAAPTKLTYTNGEMVTVTATGYGGEVFNAWTGGIVTRSNQVTLVMTNNKSIFAHFGAVTFAWTNSAGGDWHNATNWNPNLVPTERDDLGTLPAVSITVSGSAACRNVNFGGGTLTGSGSLSIYGDAKWTSGSFTGSGQTIIASNATLTINNSLDITLARTLENGGTTVCTGGAALYLNNAVITNRPGALFHVQNAQPFNWSSGSPRFDNAGTFRKSVSSGTTTFTSVAFNNYADMDVQTGTLRHAGSLVNNGTVTLAAGTTHRMEAGGSASGTFNAPASSVVEWPGGTFTLNTGAQLNGAANYLINGGTVNCDANLAVQNLYLSSTLGGSGVMTISNMMDWAAGTMTGSGRTLIAANASLSINYILGQTLARTLENAGTTLWIATGNLTLYGSVITNQPGALFHVQNAQTFNFGNGSPRFDNAGTFRKSANSGTTTSFVAFNNYADMNVQTGTLRHAGSLVNNGTVTLAAGTTHRMEAGGSASGTFNAPASSVVEWPGGTFTLNTGAQLNGAANYLINGGTVNCDANLAVQNLYLSSTLGGSGVMTISNMMDWAAGTMTGSGRTLIAANASLSINYILGQTLARTLENAGTTLWIATGNLTLYGSVITNQPGALFHVQNAQAFNFGNGSPRFDNAGTFRKSANSGTTTFGIPFNNYATVDIRKGILAVNGGFTASSNALLNCALGGTTAGTGYGQLQKSGNITLDGALSVDFLPGFTPATNDTFTVVSAGTRNGTNTSFTYPVNRVTMQLSNTPTSVLLTTTEVFPIPQPVLLTPELIGSDVKLTWTATSNVTYRLENNADAGSTNWIAVPGDVTTPSNTASKLDPLTPTNRFYRVRVLP